MVAYGKPFTQLHAPDYQQKLWRVLRRIRASHGQVCLDHQLVEGDPMWEILRAAEKSGCDLIVMGSHGRKGFRRFLMGSVAAQVTRRASCPVLTVNTPGAPEEAAPMDKPRLAAKG
jgi:nucleotide-binding universal stress UspA family protein